MARRTKRRAPGGAAHDRGLHTMLGGSGYGVPINRYLWASFILLICLPTTAAVTCRTCFDQIQGCTGGDDCPFVATTTQNGLLLGGMAAATATAIAVSYTHLTLPTIYSV